MVVVPEDMDPVKAQRWRWGQNIEEALRLREWSRKQLVKELDAVYGLEISLQSLSQWINGDVAPNPLVQAAIAGLFQTPHHLLFPPVQLERRKSAA